MGIEAIENTPTGVIAMRAVGAVTADDYRDVLNPALDHAIQLGETINFVYVLGEDFERFSLGAMWQDAKIEGLPHKSWGHIAFVTDHKALAEAVHLFRFAFPGELRIFPASGESEALEWAAGTAA